MTKQICIKCNKEKSLEEFSKGNNKLRLRSDCKICVQEYNKNWRILNKERIKEYKNNTKEKSKKWKLDNKSKLQRYSKQYKKDNPNYWKEYRENNREKLNLKERKRRETDPIFKLKNNLRKRVGKILKQSKSKSTEKLLGASFEIVKTHLESTFQEGMSWGNYGEWHVDHIVPLASAKTLDEVIKLFHYKNLQALWEFDNLSKGAKC